MSISKIVILVIGEENIKFIYIWRSGKCGPIFKQTDKKVQHTKEEQEQEGKRKDEKKEKSVLCVEQASGALTEAVGPPLTYCQTLMAESRPAASESK